MHRHAFISRIRYMLLTAVAAVLLLPAVASAKGEHSKGAGKPRQVERLRQIEKKRLQALVDADVAVAGPLIASDFELINPLGDVLSRNDVLGGVGSGALDFLSDTVTSQIRVRLHGNTAVLRFRHTIDIQSPASDTSPTRRGRPPCMSGARATGRSSGSRRARSGRCRSRADRRQAARVPDYIQPSRPRCTPRTQGVVATPGYR